MTNLLFLDTETTSLDAETGEIWEVGAILRNEFGEESDHHWLLPVDLSEADPVSLDIGRFHERHPDGDANSDGTITDLDTFRSDFRRVADGSHLVGNVISFDEERLRRMYNRVGLAAPNWHYHLVDVEALVAGRFQCRPPWKSSELTELSGVEHPGESEHHTALGDARWAMNLYDAVMSSPS